MYNILFLVLLLVLFVLFFQKYPMMEHLSNPPTSTPTGQSTSSESTILSNLTVQYNTLNSLTGLMNEKISNNTKENGTLKASISALSVKVSQNQSQIAKINNAMNELEQAAKAAEKKK